MDENDGFFQPLFLGKAVRRYDQIAKTNAISLVHYTSASSFLAILENKSVWMRNARCMNDFREVTYAVDGIREFFSFARNSKRFKVACESCHPGAHAELDVLTDGHLPSLLNGAYITCLSQHDTKKEARGRLSMWRGYGAKDVAVAIFLRNAVVREDGPYGLIGYPVEYWDYKRLFTELRNRITFIEKNRDKIKEREKQEFVNSLFAMVQYFSTSVKHPSFIEEKEWRLLYLPKIFPSSGLDLNRSIRSVNGMPQVVYQIPIDGKPINDGQAVTINELVQKVVIGPCFEPTVALEAVRLALADAGHKHAMDCVSFCGIPFREKV